MMNNLIIITGLTASGKSNLALEIAEDFNGEIISADSVQIYRGLDIGSAKATIEERSIVKHHLIDIKRVNETYNVGEFVKDCKNAIEDIISRKKLPIIVGGTALYIKALLNGYTFTEQPADSDFRLKYQNLAKDFGNDYVYNLLVEKNPIKAQSVHPNNLKRVIRYLEIEEQGEIPSFNQDKFISNYNICAVGIIEDRKSIYEKINARVDKMISLGLKDEVKHLIENGATKTKTLQSMNSIGYKEWFDYFEGKKTLIDTIELIKQHSRNYCKRQLTFLKTIEQLDLCDINTAKNKIYNFLKGINNDNNR